MICQVLLSCSILIRENRNRNTFTAGASGIVERVKDTRIDIHDKEANQKKNLYYR